MILNTLLKKKKTTNKHPNQLFFLIPIKSSNNPLEQDLPGSVFLSQANSLIYISSPLLTLCWGRCWCSTALLHLETISHLHAKSLPRYLASKPPPARTTARLPVDVVSVLHAAIRRERNSTDPWLRFTDLPLSPALPVFTSEKLEQIKVQLFCNELQQGSAVSLINS